MRTMKSGSAIPLALAMTLAMQVALMPASAPAATEATPQDRPDWPVAAEPGIDEFSGAVAINPANGSHLVALLPIASETDRTCTVTRSLDGGHTWTQAALPLVTGAPCLGSTLVYAADGSRLYAVTSEREFDAHTGNIAVSVSLDDGLTWSGTVAVASSPAVPMFDDFSAAVPRWKGNPDEVWLVANGRDWAGNFMSIRFVRSLDGGKSWSAPREVQGFVGGTGSDEWYYNLRMAGGSGRDLVLTWLANTGRGEEIRVVSSPDGGQTFGPVRIAVSEDAVCSPCHLPEIGLGMGGVAHIVYARWNGSGKNLSDIFYTWSKPPYDAWSQPEQLGNARGSTEQFQSLAIQRCGSASILHVTYADNRATPVGARRDYENIYYTRKLALPGQDWSTPIRISGQPTWFGSSSLATGTGASRRVYALWTVRHPVPAVSEIDVRGSNILSGITCP